MSYKILIQGTCNGERTNCVTGKVQTVNVIWEVRERSDNQRLILYLMNGPTGYESVYVNDLLKSGFGSWCACAGTKDRWDALKIPEDEMKKIIESIQSLPNSNNDSSNSD